MNLEPHTQLQRAVAIKKPTYPKLVIRRLELAELLGISRSTTYLREKPSSPYFDPRFPKSIKLGRRAVGFLLEDAIAYLEALAEMRATS